MELYHHQTRYYVWWAPNTRLLLKHTMPSVKLSGVSIMLWEATQQKALEGL